MDAYALPIMFVTIVVLIVGGLWLDRDRGEPEPEKQKPAPRKAPPDRRLAPLQAPTAPEPHRRAARLSAAERTPFRAPPSRPPGPRRP